MPDAGPESRTPRVVLVESNTSGTGRLFAAAARRLGCEPVLLAEDPARYPYAAEDGVTVVRQACGALEPLADCLEALAREAPLAGILSSSEYFIATAAELARRRGLPGPDPEAVRTCRDKGRQRLSLREAGVGGPAFVLVRSPEQTPAALTVVGLPAVIKPTEGTGSRGVRLCRDVTQAVEHAAWLLAQRTNERGQPVQPEVLVEEYVTWPEYSAEFFSLQALGVVRKHVSPEPYFVETGHDFPAPLAADEAQSVTQELRRALQAVGLVHGPAHVEFRWLEGRLAIMEINPRLAGGFIPELVRLAIGVDLVEATVSQAIGRRVELQARGQAHASIRFLCPARGGRMAGFTGIEQALQVAGVVDVQLYRRAGDEHALQHDFRDRIGHVVARADSGPSAARAAQAALDCLGVEWA